MTQEERLLAEILSTQTEILIYTKSLADLGELAIPGGIYTHTISVSTTAGIVEINFSVPLISISVINDDATDDVYYSINDKSLIQNQTVIDHGGTLSVNMTYPLIDRLYLQAASGTASLRIFGIEGRNTQKLQDFKQMLGAE